MTNAQKIGSILVLVALLLGAGFHGSRLAVYETEYYTVQPGDTLWDIAAEHRPEFMGIRAYVDLMEELNYVGTKIWPGQVMLIPVWREREHGI